jgi:hypothetical protein
MRHLFVSRERVVQQEYRHLLVFRLTGAVVICAAIAQIPIIVNVLLIYKRFHEGSLRQGELVAEASRLQTQNLPLVEIRQRIGQIRQWEPILQSRIPVSALLQTIERAIPPEAVLDNILVEADDFEQAQVPGGIYRIPRVYRLVIQGVDRSRTSATPELFASNLQKLLPAGSELVRADRLSGNTDGLTPFVVQFSVKPSGNYFGLGLKKIAEPESL